MSRKKRQLREYGTSGCYHVGDLPEGCRRCIRGEKLVLYTTGTCGVGCYYCTIDHDNRHRESIFVNELALTPDSKALSMIDRESELCMATGAGVTGGDPLLALNRTLEYISHLRKKYGPDYHIHLYNSGEYLDQTVLQQLVDAGMDEIRFHPKNINTKRIWEVAKQSKQQYPDLIVGFEVPAIPGSKDDLIDLILFADRQQLDFVNLNEFEFTESNFPKMEDHGFTAVLTGAAVMESANEASEVIQATKDQTTITIHFCSSSSKDSIQLVQRFKRRASQIARPFESISDEGELEYGKFTVFHTNELAQLRKLLTETYNVPDNLLDIDERSLSIETSWIIVDELVNQLRQDLPDLQAQIICRHPVENGPITWVDPR